MRFEDLSKPELIGLVQTFSTKRKFGLTWDTERTKEKFEYDLKYFIPVLRENKLLHKENSEQDSQHFLVNGDNFLALAAMQYTHKERVDVIYIDPPYNTGNKDFKYNDSFVQREDSYRHSKWLNFMSKRLKLARELLREDGIIFLSIDDNELAQLRLLCDEIFGESKFIACFIWEKKRKASNLDSRVRTITEYVLAYGKKEARSIVHPLDLVEEDKPYPFYNSGNSRSTLTFPKNTKFTSLPDGIYKPSEYKAKKTLVKLLDQVEIKNSRAQNQFQLEGEWRYSQKWLEKAISSNEEIVFKGNDFKPYWINRDPNRSKKMKTFLNFENYAIGTNEDGNDELFSIIGENDFSFPKPTSLIKALLSATTNSSKECIILDFFAGSGTTGDAVLQLNSEDGGRRQFILVTNNEGNIFNEITLPRISNLITGFVTQEGENVPPLGGSVRVLELDFIEKSNISDEMKIRLSEEIIDLLKFKEGVFGDMKTDSENYKIFVEQNKVLGIYHSFDQSELIEMKDIMDNFDGDKKAYIFTFDNFGLNPNDFTDWEEISLEAIPQKILEIIGEIYAN